VSVNTTSAPSAHRPKYYIGRPTGGVSLLTAAAATAVVVAVTVAAQRRGHVKERGRMQVTIITRLGDRYTGDIEQCYNSVLFSRKLK